MFTELQPTFLEFIGTLFLGLAVLHTFLAKKISSLAHGYPEGSVGENFFHFLGEVEVIFGLWAGLFVALIMVKEGLNPAINYLEHINYTEPVFVFVIMTMAATAPIISLAQKIIHLIARLIPLSSRHSFYIATMLIGPLLGSLVTEPAAMTLTAMILLDVFFKQGVSLRFKYMTLGLLFVNVSIGGTLSHFAAPPVVMVAGKWGWTFLHMLRFFGYKSVMAMIFSTLIISFFLRKELQGPLVVKKDLQKKMPWWLIAIHLGALGMVILTSHHMVFFLGFFLFFLGFLEVTKEYQGPVKLNEALLVAFFLAGLVTLGNLQGWWLKPLLAGMDNLVLFLGSTGLTAITDNAALTYLGSLVELSDSAKYFLVAGAVTGGGLTVIANAPNPAGYGILKEEFGEDGISSLELFKSALFPTVVAGLCFYFLP
ncbi:MAG: putative Na+/H+ antiporter [Bacteriovoracaceae bacterium]|nr:putative Na+/H+ antiporter [Bacteriovoracaceae bacterium]